MITFYTGENPGGTWRFQVRNMKTGEVESLASFHTARVVILDPGNNVLEFPAENSLITNAVNGEVTFLLPAVSPFTRPGYYVVQVELIGNSAIRKTSVLDILVKETGGVIE